MRKKIKSLMKYTTVLATILILAGMFFNTACSSAKYSGEDISMKKIKNSPNFKNGKFVNWVEWNQPGIAEYSGTMIDFLFKQGLRKPEGKLPREKTDLVYFNNISDNFLSSTWLGHSTLLLNVDGVKIITDPVFEKSVSPVFGPSRFNGDLPVDLDEIDDVDIVLISHNHYDHLNKYSIKLLNNRTKIFVVPLAVGAQLQEWGVPKEKIVELDWWESYIYNETTTVTSTPSQHFSGRGLTDRDETLWTSYVVKGKNHKIYFSGDSGYFPGFKKIGEIHGPFDAAFLECGAYNEAWHHIHMFPEESMQAGIDLKAKVIHPIHWATFNLALHPWFEPMERAWKYAQEHDLTLALPVVGGSTVFNESIPTEKWWEEEMENELVKK